MEEMLAWKTEMATFKEDIKAEVQLIADKQGQLEKRIAVLERCQEIDTTRKFQDLSQHFHTLSVTHQPKKNMKEIIMETIKNRGQASNGRADKILAFNRRKKESRYKRLAGFRPHM